MSTPNDPVLRGALGGELVPELVGGGSVYLTGEDQLRVTVLNAAAAVRVQLSGRLLNTSGEIVPYSHDFLPSTDRSVATMTRSIGEGWLLEASVKTIAGAPLIGQCYAILSIVRGSTGNQVDLSTLGAGYVTAVQRLAWPGAGFQSSLDGGGALRSITGAVPAAGAEVSETVPTGARWELISFAALLTTSATVSNRSANHTLDDGANIYFRADSNLAHAASIALLYVLATCFTIPSSTNGLAYQKPLPPNIRLGAGHRIRTQTTNLQAGDQWSAVQYLVREWIEGA
jgi:hypothetical protein